MTAQQVAAARDDQAQCPRCESPVAATAVGGTLFVGCGRCGGTWLDSHGCAEVLEGRAAQPLVALADAAAGTATFTPGVDAVVPCPVCGIELAIGTVPPTGTVVRSCAHHGTWFDRGALADVARAHEYRPPSVAVTNWIARQGDGDPVAASIASRVAATVIDAVLGFLCGALPMEIGVQLAVARVLPDGFAGWADIMVLTLLGLGCYWTWQAVGLARRGQTVGKYLEGIRIVRTDGSRAGFWRAVALRSAALPLAGALAEAVANALDGVAGLAALGAAGAVGLAISADPWLILLPARRALHDYVAGTKVVVTYVNPKHKRFSRVILGTGLVFGVLGFIVLVLSKC